MRRSLISTPVLAGIACAVMVGYLAIGAITARVSPGMLPWVLGRGLGVAAYLVLTALTALGLWLRHPWRVRRPVSGAASAHHAHAVLSAVTLLLIGGHIVALAVDRFSGVGWTGAFVPGQSGYRPVAVALGTISVYLALAVAGTASLAGWVGRVWLPIHRMALVAFALAWTHGLLAGSDAAVLRPIYAVTGAAVAGLAVTRHLATVPDSMMVTARAVEEGSR